MQRSILIALMLMGGVASAGPKYGRQVRYVGVHAIPKSEGGGICYIEGPHVHIYQPNKLEYRVHDGDYYFVGDPVAYGWDGPKYAYKGPHPIHVDAVVGGPQDTEYCYIQGPHYHYFQPEGDPDFKVVGDAYFYVGTPPPVFVEARPQYVGINAYYRPLTYTRPVVTVDAPVGWIGARAELVGPEMVVETPGAVVVDHRGGAVVEGGVGISAGVQVNIPVPSVDVHIGGPAVIVDRPPPAVIIDNRHMKHKGRGRGHW